MHKAFIHMGSNIQPEKNMNLALQKLKHHFEVVKTSHLYETAPVVRKDVQNYLNAVVMIVTDLKPREIKFKVLRRIEKECNRVRTQDQYEPRTIDLDLVLYNDLILEDIDNNIRLPDPQIEQYAHIIVPLAEIAPEFIHPVSRKCFSEIAEQVSQQEKLTIHSNFEFGVSNRNSANIE